MFDNIVITITLLGFFSELPNSVETFFLKFEVKVFSCNIRLKFQEECCEHFAGTLRAYWRLVTVEIGANSSLLCTP